MENNSSPHAAKPHDSFSVQRRSTRIDYITTVLLSGKDGSGTPFREYTQTAIVNMHGCKVRTSYRILVGMLVTLECPKAGASGKGVCVKVWDSAPGVAGHEIAVQLIKPQNLWGVPNPPADWETVAKAMAQARAPQADNAAARPAPTPVPGPRPAVAAPRPPATAPATPVVTPPPVVPTAAVPPLAPTAAATHVVAVNTAPPVPTPAVVAPPVTPPARPAPVAGPTIEQRLAELERRSTKLVESVLDILRGQAEEYTRSSLEEFRQQMDALIQDAETRMRQTFQQAYEESAGSLIGLRTDLMEQMASRGAQLIRSTEDTLRTRLRANVTIPGTPVAVKAPEPVAKK